MSEDLALEPKVDQCRCGVAYADTDSPEPDVNPDCPLHGEHTWPKCDDWDGEPPY